MASLLEQWLNTFGGNANLTPETPKVTPVDAWRENARHSVNRPNVPTSTAPPAPQPAPQPVTQSAYAQAQARAAETAAVDVGSGSNQPQSNRNSTLDRAKARSARLNPPPMQGPPSRLSNAAQHTTPTFSDSLGNKVPVPEGYEWDRTKNKWKKIVNKVGSVASNAVKPLEPILKPLSSVAKISNLPLTALYSESLGRPEDLEETEEWAWAAGTEDFTGTTFDVRTELNAIQSEHDKESTQAIAVAEENLKIIREVDASPEMIADAEKNLADVKASSGDAYGEAAAESQKELDNINLRIAQTFERYGPTNASTAKLDAESQGLFKAKEELETRLADISLVQKQRALAKNPDINKVVKAATEINPEDIDALTPEQKAAAEKAAEQAALALGDGHEPKTVMEHASGWLGELFKDEAVRKALIYYTGARLMGYSGSGSGMAAGQVLLQGWDNQAKLEAAGAETAAEAKANDSIDMSKTVNYVDKYGNFQKVYASKNGKYLNHPQLGTIDVTKTGWRPAATGEKDRQTRKLDATDSVNRIQDQVLNKLNSQTKNADGEGMYDKGNVAKVTQMFQEAGLSQQMVDSYTDSYGIDGLEKSIPMLRRAIESYASAVALGEEVNIASLMGHLDRSMITSGKTQVPKSIYHSEGKVVSSDAMNTLSK